MLVEGREQRAFYDWCQFNDQSFTEFNKWMSDQVHGSAEGSDALEDHGFFLAGSDKLGGCRSGEVFVTYGSCGV